MADYVEEEPNEGTTVLAGKEVYYKEHVLVRVQDRSKMPMFMELFKELNEVAKHYDAWVDLTTPRRVFILRATKKCRKKIRDMYGDHALNRMRQICELKGQLNRS